MAYADYQCKCGKWLSIQGKGQADADTKAKWAEGRIFCPECRAADAAKQADEQGLPRLSGSEKQVAWASEIREAAIPQIQIGAQSIQVSDLYSEAAREELRLAIARVANEMIANESAKWWIDNRHFSWKDAIRQDLGKRGAELAPLALEEMIAHKAKQAK